MKLIETKKSFSSLCHELRKTKEYNELINFSEDYHVADISEDTADLLIGRFVFEIQSWLQA